MTDPRRARDIDEACANGDGTYNGVRLLSWLSEVLYPGAGLSEAELTELAAEAQAKAKTTRESSQ